MARGASLVYGVPHLIYHATHHGGYETGDVAALLTSLVILVLAAILAAAPTPNRRHREAQGVPAG